MPTPIAYDRSRPDHRVPSFSTRMAQLLAALDQSIAWYGAHRAWPANEPARVADHRD
jgi:hypothetical protein